MKVYSLIAVALAIISVANAAPVNFSKRRFGQEHTPEADATYQAMKDISAGTVFSQRLGDLSGAAVRALLARAPKCDQQDVADECIDIAKEMGAEFPEKEEQLIPVCQKYRTLERNTPNEGQASELCDKEPRNEELKGLTQEQDPTGNPPVTPPEEEEEDEPVTPPEEEDEPVTPPEEKKEPVTPPEEEEEDEPVNPPEEGENSNTNPAFTNPVGGVEMPKITDLGDGTFEVNGNTFQQIGAAQNRQCDIQHNLCFNKFNAGDRSFSGSDCDNQTNVCKSGEPVFA